MRILHRSYQRLPVHLIARRIGLSRSAFYKNLEAHGLQWRDVKQELLSRVKN